MGTTAYIMHLMVEGLFTGCSFINNGWTGILVNDYFSLDGIKFFK